MRRIARRLAFAVALGVLSSCSTANRMSVGGPGSLVLLPPSRANDARPPRFAPRDSLASHDRGYILVSTDSLMVLEPITPERRRGATPVYRLERVARRLEISGYVTTDHRWHDWPGTVRAAGDSLEFRSAPARLSGLQRRPPVDALRLPLESIEALGIDRVDAAHSVAAAVVGVAMVSAVMVAGAIWALSSVSW